MFVHSLIISFFHSFIHSLAPQFNCCLSVSKDAYYYPHRKKMGFYKGVSLNLHQELCMLLFVCLIVGDRNRAAPTGSRGGEKEARGAGKAT